MPRRDLHVVAVLLMGCGGSSGSPPDAAVAESLVMQVRGPFYAIDHPYSDEDYSVAVDVYDRVGTRLEKVAGATVTLNGTALPAYAVNGFTTHDAGVTITPGLAIMLVAGHGDARATLSFSCPADVVLIAPPEGMAVAPDEPLTVAWTGALVTDNAGEVTRIAIDPYDTARNVSTFDPTAPRARATPDGSSSMTMMTIPVATPGFDGYALTLTTPGHAVPTPPEVGGEPWCTLWRRVHLTMKQGDPHE